MSPDRPDTEARKTARDDRQAALTEVELTWTEGRVEQWIRFGNPVCQEHIDQHRRRFGFAPGAVFGVNRWAANAYGTVLLIAATATFALNAGLWFRRGRLAMVFSSLAASCRCCAENPLIPAVQISAAASDRRSDARAADPRQPLPERRKFALVAAMDPSAEAQWGGVSDAANLPQTQRPDHG